MGESPGASSARARRSRSHRRRRRRGLRRVLGLVVLGVVLLVVLLGYEAYRAHHELTIARGQVQQLEDQLRAGDLPAARKLASSLREHTARAHNNTAGWLWDAASHVPYLGKDVTAVQASAATVDSIAQSALPTLIDLANRVGDGELSPQHGRLPLQRIAALAPSVRNASHAVNVDAGKLMRIDAGALVGPLQGMVGKLQDQVSQARSVLGATAKAMTVLPKAAGGEGPRNYLLLFQTNAEARATGGMAGSWAVLHADNGRLSLTKQGTAAVGSASVKSPGHPTDAEKTLFGSDFGKELRDANITPDFPRFAALASALVGRDAGMQFDGVFSVDPVALSFMLSGTGPVKVGDNTLTADNASHKLLNEVYFGTTNDEQNAFFQASARAVFQAITTGQGDPIGVLRGLAKGVDQRRVLAWSQRPGLAGAIRGTALAGKLTKDRPDRPQVGVFTTAESGTKLEYYLHTDAGVHVDGCTGDSQRLTVSASYRSTVPQKGTLPESVTGPGTYAPKKVMILYSWIYAPVDGQVSKLWVDGHRQTISGGSLDGRQVVEVPLELKPGQTIRIKAEMLSGPGQLGDIQLATTPGVQPRTDPVTVPTRCS